MSTNARRLSPRSSVLVGGASMVVGQVILGLVASSGAGLPSLDAAALLVVAVSLAALVTLWLGPVVVAVAARRPAWVGALALPATYAVWVVLTVLTAPLGDGATASSVETGLSVLSLAAALAVVARGQVWRRFAGVVVIAGLTGAAGSLVGAGFGVVAIGLAVAVGFLAWLSPHPRADRPPAAPTSDVTPRRG